MRAGLMASRVRRAVGCAGKTRSGRSAPRRWPKWAFGRARLAGGGVGRRGRVRGESGARRGGNGTILCGRAEVWARPSSPGEQPSSTPFKTSPTWKTGPKTCLLGEMWISHCGQPDTLLGARCAQSAVASRAGPTRGRRAGAPAVVRRAALSLAARGGRARSGCGVGAGGGAVKCDRAGGARRVSVSVCVNL